MTWRWVISPHSCLSIVAEKDNHTKQDVAEARGDHNVAALALMERCRVMLATSSFDLVEIALDELADVMRIDDSWRPNMNGVPLDKGTLLSNKTASRTLTLEPLDLTTVDVFDANMFVHYLIMRIIWESRCGRAALTSALLKELHQLFDQGTLDDASCRGGMIQVRYNFNTSNDFEAHYSIS